MGSTYNVDVTYCTATYTTPQTGLPCTPGVGVNKYTVIKKICPSGTALPPTDAATFTGVYCQMNPKKGDIFNWVNLIPYCDESPNYFCWMVAFPQCTERVDGCIVRCGTNSPCCITTVRYCRDRVTGDITTLRYTPCSGTCAQGCTDNGCDFDPEEDCEVCP